jgi:putative ABC transport system permease protein
MNLLESLRIAFASLNQNRMRALLTTLGIIIGVGAVIGLITIGQGVQTYVTSQFESLGANLLTITSAKPDSEDRTRIDPLTSADIQALANPSIAPSLIQVGGQLNVVAFLTVEGENLRTSARGVTANMDEILNWDVKFGQFISDDHIERHSRVVVLGEEAIEELYGLPSVNPVGDTIRLNNQAFMIVGVMSNRGAGLSNDNIAVFVPISTAQTRLLNARYRNTGKVSAIYAQARDDDAAAPAEAEIDAYFSDAHRIRNEDEKDYAITNRTSLLESVDQILGVLTVFLGMIAGVSLLVGGIGIMNIMLVSVTERTQEIGLRKAVGATASAILAQFLIEAIVLSLVGGAVGVGLGALIAAIGTALVPDLTLQVSSGAVTLATIVCTIIGVGFGIYPANRAAHMNPIDALRFE